MIIIKMLQKLMTLSFRGSLRIRSSRLFIFKNGGYLLLLRLLNLLLDCQAWRFKSHQWAIIHITIHIVITSNLDLL